MFAKNLEQALHILAQGSDFDSHSSSDLEKRFESLRAWGQLPRGREKRIQHLTSAEIAASVLGLVPVNPAWAGHASVALEKLKPVGGPAASFRGAQDLTSAVQLLLDGDGADELVDLMLTGAEFGTNNNGFAALRFLINQAPHTAYYVSAMAVSLLQPDALVRFQPEAFRNQISRSVLFTKHFFAVLRRDVAHSMAVLGEPAGDGSEYDAEEARAARFARLGVHPQSRFLHMGVETQVTWPKEEMVVSFDRYRFVLMPMTREHTQSVHIDLVANRVSAEEAMTVIHRFLSLLAWCDDQFAIAQYGWSGNPVPVAVAKRNLASSSAHQWIFDRQIPTDAKVLRALGHYREARNAEYAGLVSYAVLSYYKVIEGGCSDNDGKVKAWIRKNYPVVSTTRASDPVFADFRAVIGAGSEEEYLRGACRTAAAHASRKHPSDVDDLSETRRLHVAASILHALARRMISYDFNVSVRHWEVRKPQQGTTGHPPG